MGKTYSQALKNKRIKSQKTLSAQKANAEDISQQFVFKVFCNSCKSHLSQRGCKIFIANNIDLEGYSSDAKSQSIDESQQLQKCKNCYCQITKIYCKNCKNNCGIHSIYLCQACQALPINGHKWLFLNTFGQNTEIKWAQIQSVQVEKLPFQQLLKLIGITSQTLQILKKEQITNAKQLHLLSDHLLKDVGLSLGQIAKLRQLK